ncbi:hypothetical protein [Kineococcus rubinsiae]|uniref:hypothetical protein n=1 Tax=Kineococcus rubinsiae TaxID=2609562 RepID=UPI00142F481A|nr:hypothetical protein [Kineococcus rubinsiae]NIZ93461.1 hypothetical protein [Kineococcus rubinsiae]
MSTALAAAVLAALGYAAGSVLQAVGVRGGASPRDLLRSPLYLTGLGADGISWLLSLLALRRLPAFAVQAVLAGSLAVTVVLARLLLGALLRRRDVVAVLVTVAALAVVAGAGHEQASPAAGGGVVAGLAAAAGALLVAAPLLRRAPSAALAVLGGLAYSVSALAARAVDLHGGLAALPARPLAWAVVVAGGVGTWAYAAALERGSVGAATALLWAVEVVVPAVLGSLLLGDGVRAGWAPAAVVAVLAVAGAAVVLAGAPATASAEPAGAPA